MSMVRDATKKGGFRWAPPTKECEHDALAYCPNCRRCLECGPGCVCEPPDLPDPEAPITDLYEDNDVEPVIA